MIGEGHRQGAGAGISFAVLALALGPAVAVGLGRFGYGVILPEMRADLGWSYAAAGFVNTANALGYLCGALATPVLLGRIDPRRAFLGGMATVVLSLVVTTLVTGFAVLGLVRFVTGVAGAVVFVGGATLLAGLGPEVTARRGFHLAAFYAGVGGGLLLVGLLLPPLLAGEGSGDWPAGWLALAGLALPLTLGAARLTRHLQAASRAEAGGGRLDWRRSIWLLAGYLLYGLGGIGYMTFITAQLTSAGQGWQAVSLFWVVFGLGALAAPFAWQGVLERWRSGAAFLAMTSANTLAAALPLAPLGAAGLLLSSFLFGMSFFTIVAVTTLHAARVAPPPLRPRLIGLFTGLFGAGQTVGPTLTGWVSDRAGSLDAGLLAGAVLLAAGAAVGAFQTDSA